MQNQTQLAKGLRKTKMPLSKFQVRRILFHDNGIFESNEGHWGVM